MSQNIKHIRGFQFIETILALSAYFLLVDIASTSFTKTLVVGLTDIKKNCTASMH